MSLKVLSETFYNETILYNKQPYHISELLSTNIRLSWIYQLGTNNLAYYED
jgi:hypothetical protein